jgi:tripeptide aminopeptidase
LDFLSDDLDSIGRSSRTTDAQLRLHAVGFVGYEGAAAFDLAVRPLSGNLPLIWFSLFEALVSAASRRPSPAEPYGRDHVGPRRPLGISRVSLQSCNLAMAVRRLDTMGSGRAFELAAFFAFAVVRAAAAQQPAAVTGLAQDPIVKAALLAGRETEARTVEDQIRFCEVPAPPFAEGARGELLKREFTQLGLQNVRVDRAGNVLGDRPGTAARPRLVIAAHLDTVFPEGTNVKVTRSGNILKGPGIGDDCRGLAVLTAIVRSLRQANVQTPGTITFVANVGEEGLGDLRGMKALFGETMKGQIDRFVSIDGTGLVVTTVAVGSHRYKVTFKGPGGHSYGAFGLASPINALGRAVAKIAEFQVAQQPRTTFNVGRIGGGTSVNAIAFDAWMEVDMRSPDAQALASLDARFQKAVDAAVTEENARWGKAGVITVTKELVGDRPAGSISEGAQIVQTALAVGRVLNLQIPLGEGSTDANLPISLKIPAITIGGGGRGADAHALSESFDLADAWTGTQNAILLTIALAH